MIKVVIMDAFSTIHVGNGTLLENTIKICNKAFQDCEIYIFTKDIETNKGHYDNLFNPMLGPVWFGRKKTRTTIWALKQMIFIILHIINENTIKLPSRKISFTDDQKNSISIIEKCDICISCGGEVLSDTFFQALPFWLFTYWFSIRKNKILIFFPQSVGPLKMPLTRKLVRRALKGAKLLVGRDKQSYETLLSLGFKQDQVMLVPDVAIQQEVGIANIHKYFENQKKKIIGVTISLPPHREMGQPVNFIGEISRQIKHLDAKNYKILIMPSNFIREGVSTDYSLCQQLKKQLENEFETAILENRPYFPTEYTALLSQLDFFISTRMHVTIMATSNFIPTIAINTQHKIRGYMQNIGMEHFCIDYCDMNRINELVQKIIDNHANISYQLKESNHKLKQQHIIFIEKLKSIAVKRGAYF